MKMPEICECKCKEVPSLVQWTDTKRPNATWIECKCGMMTKSYYSKNADLAKKRCITDWNRKAKKRVKSFVNDLKSCEKCGSKEVELVEFEQVVSNKSVMAACRNCGLMTDEMDQDGNLRTKEETVKLWNF